MAKQEPEFEHDPREDTHRAKPGGIAARGTGLAETVCERLMPAVSLRDWPAVSCLDCRAWLREANPEWAGRLWPAEGGDAIRPEGSARLEWRGTCLHLGRTKMGDVRLDTEAYDAERWRYVLGPEDFISEPYENQESARRECMEHVRRLLAKAGVSDA